MSNLACLNNSNLISNLFSTTPMFFIFLTNCLEYQIAANSTLELLDEKKEGEIFEFDYIEPERKLISVTITDELDQIIYESTNKYGVLYTRAFKNKKFKIVIHNPSDKIASVIFRVPRVDMQTTNAFGNADNTIGEFNKILLRNIKNQRRYLVHQAENMKKIKNNGKMLIWFFIFELCFSVGLCVYYQRKLVSIFEKKNKI